MRRTLIAAVSATAMLFSILAGGPASAHGWTPGAGGWTNGTLEWVRTVPLEAGTAIDAVLHRKFLYTTSWRSFSIYDVSQATNPQLLSTTPTPAQVINENPQTNGKILLLSNDNVGRTLDVYDVSDKAAPKKLGSYTDALRNHIWECVLDCDYVYGGTGTILSLANPASPTKVGDWTTLKRPTAFHSVEEVAPGLVVTGSNPMLLLDARTDPANPTLLATIGPKSTPTTKPYLIIGGPPNTVPARIDWPSEAESRHLLVTMESPFTGACSENSGTLQTYDTSGWDQPGFDGFEMKAEYRMSTNDLPSEGSTPVNFFGCSAYGLDANPSHDKNGLAAATFFEHGTRIVRIGEQGQITQVAGFIGHGANAQAPIWRTDEVLYVIDFNRGIDVLHVTDEQ